MEKPSLFNPMLLRTSSNEYEVFDMMKIICIKADDHVCKFAMSGEKCARIVNVSLKSLMEVLPPELFVMVNRSAIVNRMRVQKIVDNHIYLDENRVVDTGRSEGLEVLKNTYIRPKQGRSEK